MSEIEGAKGAYARIQSKKTLKEILEVASSFEASARDFYQGLISKVSKNVRWIVEDLAVEEQQHYDMLMTLAARADIESEIKAEIATPVSDGRFSDAIQIPDLGEKPDDQAVLQYAMGREHLAMEHYRNLADGAPDGAIKELFEYLANEETKHKGELEKVYYETVHSGGV